MGKIPFLCLVASLCLLTLVLSKIEVNVLVIQYGLLLLSIGCLVLVIYDTFKKG